MKNEIDLIGREAAFLSIIEIGLGGVLHAFKVPFAGFFLSLNQSFFLARTVAQARRQQLARARTAPLLVSAVASLLKSLSPAGKKLTPMLAISMQGALFAAGTLSLGPTLAGAIAGSALSSLWAFIQPLMIYWLLYGQSLVEAAGYYQDKFGLFWVLATLVALKIVLAVAAAIGGFVMPDRQFERYRQALLTAAAKRGSIAGELEVGPAPWSQSARGALRDLASPLFIAPLLMTASYFYFAEARGARVAWLLLRPVALGFLLFLVIRRVSFDGLVERLEHSRFKGLGQALNSALHALRRL